MDHESPILPANIFLARIAKCSPQHSRSARTKAKRPRPRSLVYSRMANHPDQQLMCSSCSIREQRRYCSLGRRQNLRERATIACCMVEENRDQSRIDTRRKSMRHSQSLSLRNPGQMFRQKRIAQNAFSRHILCKHFPTDPWVLVLNMLFVGAALKTTSYSVSKV